MEKKQKKILLIIPDGVSLRNFVYTSFYKQAQAMGLEFVFLNLTPLPLTDLGLKEVVPNQMRQHPLTDSYKNAKKRVELNQFIKRFNDKVYHKYWFPLKNSGYKSVIKNNITKILIGIFNSEKGLLTIRRRIKNLESKTAYYKSCYEIIKQEQPDLVYCASQRAVLAIAPIQAAKELDIPTVGFVFSWDNLPKSMLDVETDYYHVWSEHMKQELLRYYPFVKEIQITVTGTPQFEPHFNSDLKVSKADFYNYHGLDKKITYFCFSGDDITTSPQDPLYLRDVALAIENLNKDGYQLGIIFRRCPVDFSDRFDAVLEEFKNSIVPVAPLWKVVEDGWNAKLPTPADQKLLVSLTEHTAGVINLGSSMVFDYVSHLKPCGYMNYHYTANNVVEKGVHVYDYVHFRSMPKTNAVYWLDSPEHIKDSLLNMLDTSTNGIIKNGTQWFQYINMHPATEASNRILHNICSLVDK
ncbi:UDP-glycosyltransferase [Winogradskyella forsetii]|uniref:UDP-glycosyltransferase n=1 Tax=Winogradskyella forsetii TaxID=2686077 RepID=UPI0015BFC273|nr:UDP-glycosyltransferase [Winogradskyella forsetii]